MLVTLQHDEIIPLKEPEVPDVRVLDSESAIRKKRPCNGFTDLPFRKSVILGSLRGENTVGGTFKLSRDWSQAWWCTPVALVLRRQRQEDSTLNLFGPTGQGKTLVGFVLVWTAIM